MNDRPYRGPCWDAACALDWLWPEGRHVSFPKKLSRRKRLSRELQAYERFYDQELGCKPDFAHLYCIGGVMMDYIRKLRPPQSKRLMDRAAFERLRPLILERLEEAL